MESNDGVPKTQAQNFQSSLYFGSPGSPTDNPFSFVTTSGLSKGGHSHDSAESFAVESSPQAYALSNIDDSSIPVTQTVVNYPCEVPEFAMSKVKDELQYQTDTSQLHSMFQYYNNGQHRANVDSDQPPAVDITPSIVTEKANGGTSNQHSLLSNITTATNETINVASTANNNASVCLPVTDDIKPFSEITCNSYSISSIEPNTETLPQQEMENFTVPLEGPLHTSSEPTVPLEGPLHTSSEPTVPLEGPLYTSSEPTVPFKEPVYTSSEPTVPLKGPLYTSSEPTVPLEGPVYTSSEPTVPLEGPLYTSSEPTVPFKEPVYTSSEPTVPLKGPLYTSSEPTVPFKEPVYTSSEPTVPFKEPVYTSSEPTVPLEGPLYTSSEPTVPLEGPVYTTSEPIVPFKEPVYTSSEPTVPLEGPLYTSSEPTVPLEGPLYTTSEPTVPLEGPLYTSSGSLSSNLPMHVPLYTRSGSSGNTPLPPPVLNISVGMTNVYPLPTNLTQLTNADVNYSRRFSNAVSVPEQPVEEVRAITEGDSNPPSASQSLSSLVEASEDTLSVSYPIQELSDITFPYLSNSTQSHQAIASQEGQTMDDDDILKPDGEPSFPSTIVTSFPLPLTTISLTTQLPVLSAPSSAPSPVIVSSLSSQSNPLLTTTISAFSRPISNIASISNDDMTPTVDSIRNTLSEPHPHQSTETEKPNKDDYDDRKELDYRSHPPHRDDQHWSRDDRSYSSRPHSRSIHEYDSDYQYTSYYYDDRDYYYRHPGSRESRYDPRYDLHYNRRDPRYSSRDPRYDPRYDSRDPRYDSRYDSRDPRYDPRYDSRDPRYDPRYDSRDPRYDSHYDSGDSRYVSRDSRYDSHYDSRDPRYDPHYNTRDHHYDSRYDYYSRDRRYDEQRYKPQPYDSRDHKYYRDYRDEAYYSDSYAYFNQSDYLQEQEQSMDHHRSVIYDQPDSTYYQYDSDQPYESTHIEQAYYDEYPLSDRYPVAGGYEEPWVPSKDPTPPTTPQRETPQPFDYPHVAVRFGIGGHLVTVLPVKPSPHSNAIVEIHSLQTLIPDFVKFSNEVSNVPGPLIVDDTPKSSVVKYSTQRSQETDADTDDSLLWKFLVLLCQQNGVVVPSDVSDLLTQDVPPASKSPRGVGVGGADEDKGNGLDELRVLLLSGRKKDALELACSKCLWGHALMLASCLDDQSRTYVVNRFTASLQSSDPLSTFYTLMLGRLPTVARPEGLIRSGDWRPHLAMMMTNLSSLQDNSCIIKLGDSLLNRGRLPAAHFCYHLAGVPLGTYSDISCKYSLLGVDHTSLIKGSYPSPEQLVRTEILEYALGLSKPDFVLPSFQTFKLLHIFKLVEACLVKKALRYCESVSTYVIRSPKQFNSTFLMLLQDLSSRLHYASSPLGVMESELPSWILTLEQSIGDGLLVTPTPAVSRDSPSIQSSSSAVISSQPDHVDGQYLQVSGGGSANQYTVGVAVSENSSTPVIENERNEEYTYPHVDSVNQTSTLTEPPAQPTSTQVTYDSYIPQWSSNTMQQQAWIAGTADSFATGTSQWNNQSEIQDHTSFSGYTTSTDVNFSHPTTESHYAQYSAGGTDTTVQSFNPYTTFSQPTPVQSSDEQQTEKETEEKVTDDSKVTKEEKQVKKGDENNSSWLGRFNPLNYLPKGPKRGYLPDDKNPRLVYDKEAKRWIDLDADEQEDTGPIAPPTDNELKSKDISSSNTNMYSQTQQLAGGRAKGRLNARSRYVDVLNTGISKATPSSVVAPPPSIMPFTAAPLQSNFFVPQPPQVVEGSDFEASYGSNNGQETKANEELTDGKTEDLKHFSQFSQSSIPSSQPSLVTQLQPPPSQPPLVPSSLVPPSQPPLIPPSQPPLIPPSQPPLVPLSQPPLVQPSPPKLDSPSADVSIGLPQPPTTKPELTQLPPSQPQFFNPKAFMSGPSGIPNRMQQSDPFPDNISEASTLSEFSQEVSQINKQAMSRTRIKPGSRPRYQYPSFPSNTKQHNPVPPPSVPQPGNNWL